MTLSHTNMVIQENTMIDPATLTASAILVPRGYANTTLAFQEFIKSGAGELAKKFAGGSYSQDGAIARANLESADWKTLSSRNANSQKLR